MTIQYQVFALFIDHPGTWFTATQLAERFEVSRAYITRVIRRAERSTTIQRRKEGRVTYYAYNHAPAAG